MKEEFKFTEKELLLAKDRLEAMPNDLSIITLGKSYSKEELIKQLEDKTGLGARIAMRELDYVKRLWENTNATAAN